MSSIQEGLLMLRKGIGGALNADINLVPCYI